MYNTSIDNKSKKLSEIVVEPLPAGRAHVCGHSAVGLQHREAAYMRLKCKHFCAESQAQLPEGTGKLLVQPITEVT